MISICIKYKIKIQLTLSKRLKTDLRRYEALKLKVPVHIYMNIYLHCKSKTIKTNQSLAIIHNIHIHLHGTTKHFQSPACTIKAKLNTALQKQRKNLNFQYLQHIQIQNFLIRRVAKQVYDCSKLMFHIGQNNNIFIEGPKELTPVFSFQQIINFTLQLYILHLITLMLYLSTCQELSFFLKQYYLPFCIFYIYVHCITIYNDIYTTFSSHKLFKSKKLHVFSKKSM